ncbi:MAG: hypothetical protein KAJ07_13125 [Planctomycetes bacterium]|nr:hypothetical protein [Planctomycetota bacterium]
MSKARQQMQLRITEFDGEFQVQVWSTGPKGKSILGECTCTKEVLFAKARELMVKHSVHPTDLAMSEEV